MYFYQQNDGLHSAVISMSDCRSRGHKCKYYVGHITFVAVDHYVPHVHGGRHTDFGAEPVGIHVSMGVGVRLSSLHNIL